MTAYRYVAAVAVAAFVLTFSETPALALDSGCVACHSNAQKIKSLYAPPEIKFEFDEGEG